MITHTAALVLVVDLTFILLPICCNFISLLRRTPLDDAIPFDKNITFHKTVAWSIVFSFVHITAYLVHFAELAKVDTSAHTTGQRVVAFLATYFITGSGVIGWIMGSFVLYFELYPSRPVLGLCSH